MCRRTSVPPTASMRRSRAAASGRARTAARTGQRCGRTIRRRRWARSRRRRTATLWAGTGEANPPGGGLTYFGDGIYKSTDDGAHWTNIGLRESASIGRIAVDPTNPDGCSRRPPGHVARSAGQRGLYRTVDGGKTWQLVLAPPNATTGAIDVAINPQNPQIVYAALWDHKRNNGARIYGGVGSGLFRSKDGGDTWERLQNIVDPLPAYDTSADRPEAGREPRPHRRRDRAERPEPGLRRLRLPVRAGQGLLLLRRRRRQLPRRRPRLPGLERLPVVVRALWVDPETRTTSSTPTSACARRPTAARRGRRSAAPHSDQHAMDWDPSTLDATRPRRRVFLGNDGGMYRSDANGVNGSWMGRRQTNQPWNQTYHLAVSKQDPQRHDDRPAGQRLGAHVDGARAVADRSGADATGTPTAAVTATGT